VDEVNAFPGIPIS